MDQKKYDKGIGVHAPSELVYECKDDYKRFVAVVGLDRDPRSRWGRSSVVFEVHADKLLLASSPLLKNKVITAWHFDVPVPPGTKNVRLVVTDGGDGKHEDYANWVEAGFKTSTEGPSDEPAKP